MSADDLSIEYRRVPSVPGYWVGNDGSVWCSHNTRRHPCPWRRISGTVTPKGYRRVMLQPSPGRHAMKMVHVLVLEAFVGPCPEGMECRHLDGDPLNNRLGNLAWGTPKENTADTIRHGRKYDTTGSGNGRAIIDEPTAADIKRLIARGVPNRSIANRFGVSSQIVSRIRGGRRWTHVG